METAVKKLYEAMFLVDAAMASDWDAVVKTIKTVLKRSDAEIVAIRNWAERKLAYEINQKSRGTYVLCFFKADGSTIPKIEKDVQLSEQILRVLILSTETRDEKDVEKDILGTQDEGETAVEDAEKDIETRQREDIDDYSASPQETEVDQVQESAELDFLDAIESQPADEHEPDDAIESQPAETEKDNREKDATD